MSAKLNALACPRCGHLDPARSRIEAGAVALDRELAEVRIGGRRIAMPPQEFEALWLLASRAPAIVPRWYIEEACVGETKNPNDVSVLIYRVRARLPDRDLIETVCGQGYRLRA